MSNKLDDVLKNLSAAEREQLHHRLRGEAKSGFLLANPEVRNLGEKVMKLSQDLDQHPLQVLRAVASVSGISIRKVPSEMAKPKYRNPDNPNSTWSGMGIVPAWLADLEAAGQSREEFLIQKEAA